MAKTKPSNSRRAAAIFREIARGNAEKADNLILRLLRGEYSPTLTFWLFCLSIPLAADLLFSRLLFPMLDMNSTKDCSALIVWALAIALYMAIANVGLWRSAERQASPRQALPGKCAAVLGMLAALAYVARWYGIWMILSA